ncbi:hypothetical protein ACLOJK_028060 [Asimina triloba]
MSPTPDSPTSNSSSPRPSPRSGDGPNSPRPHRAARGPPSQWAHVVRSTEPESGAAAVALSPAAAQSPEPASDHDLPKPLESDAVAEASVPEASDGCGGNGDACGAQAWKPAWNKLSNGAVEVGPVMGASWPPLSESARASPRSSSESLKSLADGSVSPSPSPVITSSPKKQITNNQNHNPTPNTAFPARQKSMKRFGVTTQPSSETPPNASEKSPAAVLDSPHRESAHKNSNWESGSRPHAGNEYPRPRRGGGGQQPRGDGFYNNSYGNRRDQERLNYEWNPNRNFSGRGDGHIQQQPRVMARNFMRPPPLTRPFMAPPPVRTLGSPLEMPSPGYFPSPVPDSFRGMPFVVPAPVFIPQPDPHLRTMLIKQIEYYFSPENLCKDIFLRQNMDEHGWVSISLIANFNRVKHLTHDIQFILDAVRTSTVVELMGDKIRKRGDWERWRLASGTKTSNVLVGQMQNLGLEEGMMMHTSMKGPSANTPNEGAVSRSSSGDLNSPSQVSVPGGTANREGMNQATVQNILAPKKREQAF